MTVVVGQGRDVLDTMRRQSRCGDKLALSVMAQVRDGAKRFVEMLDHHGIPSKCIDLRPMGGIAVEFAREHEVVATKLAKELSEEIVRQIERRLKGGAR